MTQSTDIATFAPPEAPLPMPLQVIEPSRRPAPGLRRVLAGLTRPAAD